MLGATFLAVCTLRVKRSFTSLTRGSDQSSHTSSYSVVADLLPLGRELKDVLDVRHYTTDYVLYPSLTSPTCLFDTVIVYTDRSKKV
jgi:hypothetical protein